MGKPCGWRREETYWWGRPHIQSGGGIGEPGQGRGGCRWGGGSGTVALSRLRVGKRLSSILSVATENGNRSLGFANES